MLVAHKRVFNDVEVVGAAVMSSMGDDLERRVADGGLAVFSS